jgi:hypothetical protein
MRISPIDGNRREGPGRSLVEWHDPKSEGLPSEAPQPEPAPKLVQKPKPAPPTPFNYDDTEAGEEVGESNFPSEPNSGQLS